MSSKSGAKDDGAVMVTEENKSGGQKAAEAEVEGFRRKLGPFVVAAETTRMPMVFTDAEEPDHPIIFANGSFLALTGYSLDEVLARNFIFLMAQANEPEALATIQAAFDGHTHPFPEICSHRKDGSALWVSLYVSPVLDENGDVVQHLVSMADLTGQRRERDRLRFLLGELNHRTQNLLAIVLAIARQTLRGKADPEVVDAFEGRILALSDAHRLLGRANWNRLGLRDVVDQILEPFGLKDRRAARFSVSGEDVRLQPKTALTLAMVFHELAANAIKHGALSPDAAGRVHLAWQVEPSPQGDRMRLRWQESGGPPVIPPRRKGFGLRLIQQGLAQEPDGEVRLDFEPAAVVCEIVLSLPSVNGFMSHE